MSDLVVRHGIPFVREARSYAIPGQVLIDPAQAVSIWW